MKWNEAEAFCETGRGYLVSIENAFDSGFLTGTGYEMQG